MKFKCDRASVPRFAILFAAILLGVVIGIGLGPGTQSETLRSSSIYLYLVAALGVLLFVALGVVLELAIDREHQLDRDLLRAFLKYIPDNVYFKDRDSRFVRISSAMAKYCNLADPRAAIQKTDADIFSPEHAQRALNDEEEMMRTGVPMIEKEEKETWPDGHETWVLTTKVPLRDRQGKTIGTMGISHNITDRKQAELRLHHQALHDVLTGLPNRKFLEERLNQAIAEAVRNEGHVAVLMLDLDRFRNVNDTLGHLIGDRSLELIAKRLKNNIRESDTIARIGGDEFAIVVPNLTDNEDVERFAKKVQAALCETFRIEGREAQFSAGIGIALFPDDGERSDILLRAADSAMYEAKRRGCGRHCFFSASYTEATRRQQQIESDLILACSREEFVLHYQPFVDTNSGRITGMEALLRWQHPEHGLLPPSQFIPALEKLGLMVEVGRWILRSACLQAVDWQHMGLPPIRMSVNVSPQQFREGNMFGDVQSALHQSKLDAKLLELELTESQVLDDSESILNILRRLKQLGVSLAVDDFGTGWSSLSYLRRFPFDRLKIDRSFVRDIGSQKTADAMLKGVLGLGKTLEVACIAEGVETRKQYDYLKHLGCAEMQGFYYSRPLAAVEATALLRYRKLEPQGSSASWQDKGNEGIPAALQSEAFVANSDRDGGWLQ
jgi:diguanylate cyclase (GGDEF)-like protein/PAS domain S-box-containing protein